jgi:hypothetical protein
MVQLPGNQQFRPATFNGMEVHVLSAKNVNEKIRMKKHIWLGAFIAGMLSGIPSANAPAAVSVYSSGSKTTFVINSQPSFVYLRTQGFSISVGSPYDIVYYGNRYYLNHNGRWYRSYSYRGPWILIGNTGLPLRIRRHRLEDIRRYRDFEYRKSDSRNNRYQRNDDNRRRVLEQKYKSPGNRQGQEQPKQAPESRKLQQPPMRVPEGRQSQDQPNRAPEVRKVLEQPIKAPEGRKAQDQPNRVPEGRKVQEQQNRAPEGRKPQEQQKKDDNRGDNKGKEDKRPE